MTTPGIARLWRAVATRDGAAAYARYFAQTLQPALQRLAGFRGANVLVAEAEERARILVITRWASMDAVAALSGPDASRAVVEPEARTLLLSWDAHVEHFAVVLDAVGIPPSSV